MLIFPPRSYQCSVICLHVGHCCFACPLPDSNDWANNYRISVSLFPLNVVFFKESIRIMFCTLDLIYLDVLPTSVWCSESVIGSTKRPLGAARRRFQTILILIGLSISIFSFRKITDINTDQVNLENTYIAKKRI